MLSFTSTYRIVITSSKNKLLHEPPWKKERNPTFLCEDGIILSFFLIQGSIQYLNAPKTEIIIYLFLSFWVLVFDFILFLFFFFFFFGGGR